ncbi:MAG: vWA domain-containing protein [Actinomycetota bacterium]
MHFRYSRWDGTQDPFGPDVPAADVLEELADEILMGGNADHALQRLLRRGMRGRFSGLDALRRRLRQQREQEESLLDLTGPLDEIRERLEEILERERTELSFRDDDDARSREAFLDTLPPDAPGRLGELREYRFADPTAQRMFDELQEHIREQVMGSYFRQMAEGMRSMTPEDIARFKDMLAELNGLIEMRERGQDTQPAFEDFMSRHGDLFPDDPQTLDELLESMARRMAAMSALMASLSPEQREELAALAQQVMQDMDLAFEIDRLSANLQGAFPGMAWGEGAGQGQGFGYGEGMPMSATVDALERLHDYEELDRAMQGDYAGASLDDVDEDAVRRRLGDTAAQDLRHLKQIERMLERAGLVQRRQGRLEITPRGARKLGERALTQIFEELQRDREGTHEARDAGGHAEPTGATRPWTFGDQGQLAVQRTVFNAVTRSRPGEPVRLRPDDFEMVEAEQRTETATALLLDLSFSMPLRGHFIHAKKMALALHALIEGRYPHDTLYLIGFSDYARQLQPEDLAAPGFERVYGTNMQHAFMLANRLLAQHPRATRQVIMVTDGEPTAHLQGDAPPFFAWPPVPETIELTLGEAMRLAKAGVRLNIFMLEDSEGLARFMERLARITKGRVFLMDDDRVGEFVLRDYVARRAR